MGAEAADIEVLQRRLREIEMRDALVEAADALLEQAVRARWPLSTTMERMLPLLADHAAAEGVFVHTWDEDLRSRDYAWQWSNDGALSADELAERVAQGGGTADFTAGPTRVLGHRLEVAGDDFGFAALALSPHRSPDDERPAPMMLRAWCEELDNYLAAIVLSRQKHRVTGEIAAALRHPVLHQGIEEAIQTLGAHVPFDDLVLAFRYEDELRGSKTHYRVVRQGRVEHDSRSPGDPRVDTLLREQALRGQDAGDLARAFGIPRYCEQLLIHGIRDQRLLGRVLVGRRERDFNTFDRDLLERFAESLCQRIVDFNRQWKHLSASFPQGVVERLLSEERYIERFLRPREREVAIMYGDIAGFTRLSEQQLREPALIGRLMDVWSQRVVEIIWETGGVFDKMVGDCVIGLWGPPLFEMDARSCCRRAAEAAARISEFTRSLSEHPEFPQLRDLEPPPGVAIGVNWCPLYVGLFGPNEDYTGFSSGMNNTARLQGVAERDEILCMDSFVRAYGDDAMFGDERAARVKNVTVPLRFRELRCAG